MLTDLNLPNLFARPLPDLEVVVGLVKGAKTSRKITARILILINLVLMMMAV